jgi:hypothetical protein
MTLYSAFICRLIFDEVFLLALLFRRQPKEAATCRQSRTQ